MHELSIASSILELARRHVPLASKLRSVRVRVGPLLAIEPDAMQFAWQAVTHESGLDDVEIAIDLPAWKLRCADCGREWESAMVESYCACGSERAAIVDSDELQLVSIQVDDLA